jgi:hypothetical protein
VVKIMTKYFAGPGVLGLASAFLSAVWAAAPAFAAWAADDPPADASATVSADKPDESRDK